MRRVDSATVEDIARCLERDEPLLVAGGLERTALVAALAQCPDDRARLSLLASTFGSREISIVSLPVGGRLPGDRKATCKVRFDSFAEMLGAQLDRATDARAYLQNHPVGQFPELGWQRSPLSVREGWEHGHSGLWIGPGGQTVNFHYDNSINLMCMVNGVKRVALLPFEALPDMYPVFDPETNVTASSVRLLDVDWDRAPRYRQALRALQVAVIEPGDILLVPPHWWHHVESFGLNMMISNWFSPFPLSLWRAIGRSRAEAMLMFRDASPEVRATYARRYDERVFSLRDADTAAQRELAGGERFDQNLAEAAVLFRQVPEIWRRHGQLSYHYFVFQLYGRPMDHMPEAFGQLLEHVGRRLERGEPLAALG